MNDELSVALPRRRGGAGNTRRAMRTRAADELFPAAGRQGYSLRARSNQNREATGVGWVLAQKEINS